MTDLVCFFLRSIILLLFVSLPSGINKGSYPKPFSPDGIRATRPGHSASTTRLSFLVPRILVYNGIVLFFFSSGTSVNSYNNLALFPASLFVPLQNVQNRFLAYRLMHPLSNLNHLLRLVDQVIVQSFLLLIGIFFKCAASFFYIWQFRIVK